MVGVLTLWYYYHESSWVYLFVVVFLQVLLGALEYRWPAARVGSCAALQGRAGGRFYSDLSPASSLRTRRTQPQ